jgi:hypothetical protein
MPTYSLQTLLSCLADSRGKKRVLLNMAPIGGVGSRFIIAFFLLLPIIEYALFFNPYVFGLLGIATAILGYIVCLSLVMIIIFLVGWRVNSHIIKKITSSWEFYFPQKSLEMVLSSGITPYNEFFDYYVHALKKKMDEHELHMFLLSAFSEMEEKNKELLEAINRNKKLSH